MKKLFKFLLGMLGSLIGLILIIVIISSLWVSVSGKVNPSAKLPFEMPSSMEAVRNQKEDMPYDSKDPLFPFGSGLSY